MTNPYEILGVDKNASEQDIKQSYREKAKQAHPDAGGDVEQFGALVAAYEILSDADRRAYYDRTGADKAANQPQTQAFALVMGMIDELITNLSHGDLITTDIVKKCTDTLNKLLGDMESQERMENSKLKFLIKSEDILNERLHHKKHKTDYNLFLSVLADKQKNIRLNLGNILQQKEVLTIAIDIISDFEFDAKKKEEQPDVRNIIWGVGYSGVTGGCGYDPSRSTASATCS